MLISTTEIQRHPMQPSMKMWPSWTMRPSMRKSMRPSMTMLAPPWSSSALAQRWEALAQSHMMKILILEIKTCHSVKCVLCYFGSHDSNEGAAKHLAP
eukprot:574731-Karenia_brevis.AAC.1